MNKNHEHRKNSPLLLAFNASGSLKRLVFFMYLLALLAALLNSLAVFIKISLVIGLVAYYRWVVHQSKGVNYQIKYSDESGWELAEASEFMGIDILQSTVITTQLLFLHFNFVSNTPLSLYKKHTLLILNDQLTPEDYCSLIVKLKMTVIK
jgi:hypothetical protein